MKLRRAQPSESREVREWIIARHYLGSAPPGYVAALEFLSDAGERVGAMLLGRPTSRELDAEEWLEVTRIFFIDETPLYAESRGLAQMRKWVRTWLPQTRGLISYSDEAVGHAGTIYRADGWARFGRTKLSKRGWRNRPGRKGQDVPSRKTRWIRTP